MAEGEDAGAADTPAAGAAGSAEADAAGELTVPRRERPAGDGPWVLDDGVGTDEVPWDDFDPAAMYLPRGRAHFGVTLRGAGLIGDAPPAPNGPWFEAGIFFDLRYSPRGPWHLRFVSAVSLQPTGQGSRFGEFAESSAFAIRVRVMPLFVDLGDLFSFRAGGGLMLGWVTDFSGGGSFEGRPEFLGEVVARLFEGRFEVGVFAGMTYTIFRRMSSSFSSIGEAAQALLGLTAGYVVQ